MITKRTVVFVLALGALAAWFAAASTSGVPSARPAAAVTPAPANEVVAPAPAAPVEPPFKLIGIAEDNGTRTAILSSPSQLLMVHDGDNAGSYRVTGISADAIELKSTADDSVLRLALK